MAKLEKEFIGYPGVIKHDFKRWVIKKTVLDQLYNPFATVSLVNLTLLNGLLEGRDETKLYRLTFNKLTGVMNLYDHDLELEKMGIQVAKPQFIKV